MQVLSIISLVVWIIITGNGELEATASSIIRWTARTSLVAFTLAYVARPALQLWRNAFTKHIMAERKWIGLGFAASHAAHLGGIIALASPDVGAFIRARAPTTAVAALTFVVLFAMAITSIDRIRKKMNARAWKLLHRTGMHLSWISFTSTYVAAAFVHPAYAVPSAVLLTIGAIRLMAWLRGRASRAAVV
jgi:DMSO/TMAO reductase YedYZ heme-binding membrane subunit